MKKYILKNTALIASVSSLLLVGSAIAYEVTTDEGTITTDGKVVVILDETNKKTTVGAVQGTATLKNKAGTETSIPQGGTKKVVEDGTVSDLTSAEYGVIIEGNPALNNAVVLGVVRTDVSTIASLENGTFQVKLNKKPTANVVVRFTVKTSEQSHLHFKDGSTDYQEDLTFTPDNWNTTQSLVVTAKEIIGAAGANQASKFYQTHKLGTGSFGGEVEIPVTVGKVVALATVKTPTNLSIAEKATGQLNVKLNRKPSANVVVKFNVKTAEEGHLRFKDGATDYVEELFFTTANWNTGQNLAITAKEVGGDGTTSSKIYQKIKVGTGADSSEVEIPVTITDTVVMATTRTSFPTGNVEEGSSAVTATVKLNKKPSGNVNVFYTVQAGDTAYVELNKDSGSYANTQTLTFTTGNWDTAQNLLIKTKVQSGLQANKSVVLTEKVGGATATNLAPFTVVDALADESIVLKSSATKISMVKDSVLTAAQLRAKFEMGAGGDTSITDWKITAVNYVSGGASDSLTVANDDTDSSQKKVTAKSTAIAGSTWAITFTHNTLGTKVVNVVFDVTDS